MDNEVINSSGVPCHVCGYDLRAHAANERCPECGASVAEAQRLAEYPRRPTWGKSDPRWRRRMVAGTWLLVLFPVMYALQAYHWLSSVPVPDLFGRPGAMTTLSLTFLAQPFVYQPLLFCTGLVLLFAHERGRRPARLDWTRRWGVLCCYVIALISAGAVLLITALVALGISALFLSLPPAHQPAMTLMLVDASRFWLHYGPTPERMAGVVLAAFSSSAMLLACAALFNALRSSGPRWLAAIVVGLLALFAVAHLGQAGWHVLGPLVGYPPESTVPELYFSPGTVLGSWASPGSNVYVEVTKFGAMAAAAIWLSIAQLRAWWHRRRGAERPPITPR